MITKPRQEYPIFKRWADYLASHMRDLGVTGTRVEFAKDNDVMLALLRAGEIDVITETVFSALVYADEADAELLLREWRYGTPTYRAILVARRDSGIEKLDDLRGRRLAFEDPGSTSAFFVPRLEIQSAGLRLVGIAGPRVPPPVDGVGYEFSGEELNTAAWVQSGRVDAGALSSDDWRLPERLPPSYKEGLVVFHESGPLPRSLVVVRGDLPAAIKTRVKDVLVRAHDDPDGAAVLAQFHGVDRYDELAGGQWRGSRRRGGS